MLDSNGGGSGYTADFQKMAQGAEAVSTAHAAIGKTLADMDSDVQTMLSAWRGEGSAAYASVQARWGELASKINATLDNMHASLVDTRADYQRQEQQVAQDFHVVNLGGN